MPPREELCRNFQHGSCRYGDYCKFLHDMPQQSQPGPFGFGTQTGTQFQHTNPQQQKPNPFGFGVQNYALLRGSNDFGSRPNQFKPFENKWTRFSPLKTNSSSTSRQSDYQTTAPNHKIKISVSENIPLLRQASENTGHHVLLWARRGSPFRLLLVVSVGTIALLTLTGFTVFLIFFVAATINAIVITLLMSLAAAGGFLAIFFACVASIYIGALMVSVLVISSATVLAIFAVVIVTGWIGFFWAVWAASKKSIGIAKHSVYMTGSALSVYSPARHHHK